MARPTARRERGGSTRQRTTEGYGELVQRLGLDDPRRAVDFARGELVVDSGSSRVMRFRDPEPAGALFYYKVYRYYRLRPKLTFSYRPSRARIEYEALIHLRRAGLPAPEPVAFGSHRRYFRIIQSCYVLSRGVEGAVNLEQWLAENEELVHSPGFRALRRRALLDLADHVRRMHEADFFDHDLWYRNILVTREHPEAPIAFHFIDHPKARVISRERKRARRAAVVHDLMSLDKHAPRTFRRSERLRFFKRYLGRDELTTSDRALLRDVERLRQKMIRRREAKLRRRARERARGASTKRAWDVPLQRPRRS